MLLMRISLLSLMLSLSGCVPVPPVWDAWDEIYQLDFIEPGVTTKDQVLGRLGEPDTRSEGPGENDFIYRGKTFDHLFITVLFQPIGGKATDWWVTIEFDENDVVTEVSTSEGDIRRSKTAEQPGFHTGSVATEGVTIEDIIESERRMYFRRQLKMACSGDKPAQYLVALHYDRGEGVERDKVQAFKWYSLAHPDWPEAIRRKQMTPSEIAEAKRLVAEWRPNQAGCETNIATAGQTLAYSSDGLTREVALREQWRSLCQRAVAGDGEASSAVASHFRHGWQPVEKDLVKAYLWYAVASDWGYSSAIGYRKDLESEMSSTEISEAKQQLVEDWEPDPAKCGLERAQTDS